MILTPLLMIHVTCAIIHQNKQILCAQRSEIMKHPLKWEFPGGKVEAGEELDACLVREIQEELNVKVQVGRALRPHHHSYEEGKEITLHPLLCTNSSGDIFLKEHKELRWMPKERLQDLDWAIVDEVEHIYVSLFLRVMDNSNDFFCF